MGYRRILTDIDEDALKQIAEATGGQFFRAEDTATIETAFNAVDKTKKIPFESKVSRPRELFPLLLGLGAVLIVGGGLMASPPWRKEVVV